MVVIAPAKPHKSGPDNATPYWANNSLTGYCGQTDGGYVVAAQVFLYTYGTYPGPIDNYWGSNSSKAMVAYQADSGGLQRDGCVGPKSWADMQARTTLIGYSGGCGTHTLRVYRFSRGSRTAYFDRSEQSGFWYADAYLKPTAAPVAQRPYRFSDNLKAYC